MSSDEFLVAPEAWEYLARDLKHIQSPEARSLEANYRFDNLLSLIDSGEWEVDAAHNVYPASMTLEQQATILECARFCVIGELPKIVLAFPDDTDFKWLAAGLVIGEGNVINVDYPGQVTLTIQTG
jgi:hypothetical protein